MIKDRNKGISQITYNHLNLPTQIEFEGTNNKITYLYNSVGQKLNKTVYYSDSIKIVDYLDGFQYAGNILQFFPHAEGYVKATPLSLGNNIAGYAYNYVFNYIDHLGNVRVSYSKDPQTSQLKILEENHYYPFGLKHSVYSQGKKDFRISGIDPGNIGGTVVESVTKTDYHYRYNGFEYQDELGLNWYDYQWRNYDPALGRWFNIDPLAEMSRKTSPYAYALNNPVFFIDPDGMLAEAFDIDDDYKLNQDGSIELIQRTDATTDTLYATDASGNVDQNNSITVSKGVLDNTETVQIEDRISDPDNNIPTRIMDATATENSQELFEFMSDNTTNVEHSIANYENGKTFIGTSFRENAELSLTHTMNAGNGNLISHDHSHPSGTGPSSDDMSIAGRIEDLQPGTTPTFRIYNPTTGGYSTYDRSNGGTELNEAVIIFQKK